MNFEKTIKTLREGKKISRPCWNEGSYWVLGIDESIVWNDTKPAVIHLNQIDADDFEVYDERNKKIEELKSMVKAINVLAEKLNIKKLDKEYSKKSKKKGGKNEKRRNS